MIERHDDFTRLAVVLSAFEDVAWWIVDPPLKYISIHMDTRENMYVLKDRDQNLIEPQRVFDAVESYNSKFGPFPTEETSQDG